MDLVFCVVALLLLNSVASPLGRVGGKGETDQPTINVVCDDGKYLVEEDLGGEENWRCQGDEFSASAYLLPAGYSECSRTHKSTFHCMGVDMEYPEHPPSSGDYRPLAPKYGEYRYLPPQRWLHALHLGAVAFLYHPCAPLDQVEALKQLGRSCLWKHIITPYPHLNETSPLALVSWGCVYRMSWVDTSVAKPWIVQHALHTPESSATSNGAYDEGLVENAEILVSTQICPDTDPEQDAGHPTAEHATRPAYTGVTEESSSQSTPDHWTEDRKTTGPIPTSAVPCKEQVVVTEEDLGRPGVNCASTSSHTVVHVLVEHYNSWLVFLLVAALLIVLLAMVLVTWKLCCILVRRRRKRTRYKSVSKFFPFSYGREEKEVVTIPEMGPPKGMSAEREKLLNESDEDEL